MISTGLMWLIASTVTFLFVLFLVSAEQKRGSRFLLVRARAWSDKIVAGIGLSMSRSWDHFNRYVVQLGWYYGLHSLLRALLKTLIAFYERVEHVFEINRKRTKLLRAERRKAISSNHLTEMAEHKANSALTPSQQKKLKESHLEGD